MVLPGQTVHTRGVRRGAQSTRRFPSRALRAGGPSEISTDLVIPSQTLLAVGSHRVRPSQTAVRTRSRAGPSPHVLVTIRILIRTIATLQVQRRIARSHGSPPDTAIGSARRTKRNPGPSRVKPARTGSTIADRGQPHSTSKFPNPTGSAIRRRNHPKPTRIRPADAGHAGRIRATPCIVIVRPGTALETRAQRARANSKRVSPYTAGSTRGRPRTRPVRPGNALLAEVVVRQVAFRAIARDQTICAVIVLQSRIQTILHVNQTTRACCTICSTSAICCVRTWQLTAWWSSGSMSSGCTK